MNHLLRVSLAIFQMMTIMACAPSAIQKQQPTRIEEIVATVNGESIKKAEYKQELDSTYQRLGQAGQILDGTMYAQLKNEVRESLIHLVLLDQYSRELSIKVNDTLVEKHYQKKVNKYPSQKAYQEALIQAGLTEADLRTRTRRTLAAQQVVDSQVSPGIDVTQEEIKAYYDANPYEFEHDVQVHAAHILIKISPLADRKEQTKTKERILTIKKKISSGEDFATLAKKFSEGPSSVNGGDIGYFGSAQMAPEFETAAFSLQPGQVSNVVKTQFGYHLIKVYDRKPAGKESFSEVLPRLKARFHQERLDNHLGQLVEKLKSKAQIERLPLE